MVHSLDSWILKVPTTAGRVVAACVVLQIIVVQPSEALDRTDVRRVRSMYSTEARAVHSGETPVEELGEVATQYGNAGYVIETSGHYVLTRNLSVPEGDDYGILVLADHVTLDLNSYVIADPLAHATIIGVIGSVRTAIRNGRLEGGARGLVASGAAGSTVTSIDLNRLSIASSPEAVIIDDVYDVSLRFNNISARDSALVVRAPAFLLIANNRVETPGVGIRTLSVSRGEIHSNTIRAGDALSVNGTHIIERNTIRASRSYGVDIVEGYNQVSHNDIRGDGIECGVHVRSRGGIVADNRVAVFDGAAVCVSGYANLLERNVVNATGEPGLLVSSQFNHISGNRIYGDTVAVRVGAGFGFNLVEDNRVNGQTCGVAFNSSGQNVYRDNLFGGGGTICGGQNIDGGGNVFTDSRSREVLRQFPASPRHKVTRNSQKQCPFGEITMINSMETRETPFGSSGLVIDESGCYLITSDLVVPDSGSGSPLVHGLLILAPDVVIDFGGHSVSSVSPPVFMARAIGSQDVSLRNGTLIGGGVGLGIEGDLVSQKPTSVELDGIRVTRGNLGLGGLAVRDVDLIEIRSSSFSGDDVAASIAGPSSGRIVGSGFGAADVGLYAPDLHGADIVGNSFGGGGGLLVGTENRIQENLIAGLFMQDRNHVTKNRITGDLAFKVFGDGNLIESNLIEGRAVGIQVEGSNNTVRRNRIWPPGGIGVKLSGVSNALEGNLVVEARCGLAIESGLDHFYRDNVVLRAEESVCGVANDGGGNILTPPTCGNGIRGVDEACDGVDGSGESCQSIGYEWGFLKCNDSCNGFYVSSCGPGTCGNGLAEDREGCDGADHAGRTCKTYGFDGGAILCTQSCAPDISGCEVVCGNGESSGTEVCDGQDLNGATCGSRGFDGGVLACAPSCDAFDTTGCRICGDGTRQSPELCDGGDLNGQTCQDVGFDGGVLACHPNCFFFDMTSCTTVCGDGIRRGNEVCDDEDLRDHTCESQGYPGGGVLSCAATCDGFDYTGCIP